ncbi:MAG: hypothetical protein AAF630_14590 [Cyanobacteria bacterium P01_C01_bin.38]
MQDELVMYLEQMPYKTIASLNLALAENTKQYSDNYCLTNTREHKRNQYVCSQNQPLASGLT